ncbi:antitoxin [Streptomyces sp. S465]|uniref:antitoxin n=1 Tax=Streptomyces sp. S465 TaxID=2979468 RepID=UPI0022A88427|nr:antitoxin [Streptomyces sp. S465]WAP60980.1 antitoxin [Streptomyces sp. S465]
MGLMDNLKAKAGQMKGKAGGFAQQHEARIERGLEKAAKTVDTRTKGKYSAKIETGTGKAKDALNRLSRMDDEHKPTSKRDT